MDDAISLCRIAGLRRGEALDLTWSGIDWKKRRLSIIAAKTGRRRVMPIQPKLYRLLLDAFELAEEGEERICPISRHYFWRNFQAIRKRAELPKWEDAFRVMRKNCETDWAQRYPQYAVSAWLQVPEELYQKVAGTNLVETATKSSDAVEAQK